MTSTSVSRAISGGNGGKGAASWTMRRAAWFSTACGEGWSISTLAMLPSARTDTVMRRDP